MSLGLTFFLHESLCYLSFYVTWSHFRYAWVLVLPKFLCRLVSLLWCIGSCVVWGFYINSSRIHYIWVLCCLCFYVTWSHFRSVRVSMLSEFLYHLVSFPLYMGLVLSEFLCHLVSLRSVCISMLSEFLCHLISFHYIWVFVLSEILCHLISLPLYIGPCVVWVSMSLDLASILCVLCCLNFYVTWFRFHYIWVLVFSEFLCHLISILLHMGLMLPVFLCRLVSLPFCMRPCVVSFCYFGFVLPLCSRLCYYLPQI